MGEISRSVGQFCYNTRSTQQGGCIRFIYEDDMKKARILGTGHYVPENVVTNEDMTKRLNTSDEWIQQRSGVKERRFVTPGTQPSELAHKATMNALEAAELTEKDIDLIICATQTPEHMFPGTACYIQKRMGIPGVPALDVRDQCTGFLYGLSIADAYIKVCSRDIDVVLATLRDPLGR